MAELRSRSPRAGLETAENGTTKEEQIRKDLEDLKNLVHMQGGRINTLDQRSAHTRDQVQKQQQLEASKQAIVTSWPDTAGPPDRIQAVEQMVDKHASLKGKYASTTTLRTKTGWSQFSIVDFFTKESRNDFLDLVRRDALTCFGQIQVARAQIPKYQREADQPLRCAIAVFAQITGKQQRFKPTWEMSAVWHHNKWILSMQADTHDKTHITLYVAEAAKDTFTEKFHAEWQSWGGHKGTTKRADGYRPQDYFQIAVAALTPETATALDTQYATLQQQKKQAYTKEEDEEMDGREGHELRGRGSKGAGKNTAQTRQ